MKPLFFLPLAYILTGLLLPWGLKTMKERGAVAKNYQDLYLPMPAGLLPITIYLFLIALGTHWFKEQQGWLVFSLSFVLVILGILDDWKGDPGDKGFKGHLRALRQGRFTTGTGKALGGGGLAISGAMSLDHIDFLFLNTLLIALITNFVNLLDLRPGRALKFFLGMTAILFWVHKGVSPYWLFVLVGAILAYLPYDLRSQGMLGDTGANILGFVLGLTIVMSIELTIKIVVLVALFGAHIYAERYSISKLIEQVPFLNFLDGLGRPDY